ncbi:MAG: DUF4279 domain-containing protein [Candidatus Thiodiazotropha endolucinida]
MNNISENQVVKLSLRLWGERLKPEEITEAFGFEPSYSYEKGYRKPLPGGRLSAPRELGIWVFQQAIKHSLEDELYSFLNKIKDKDLKCIKGVQIIILDLYLGLSDNDSVLENSYECRIDNNVLLEIAQLGVDFRITVS